MAPKLLQEALNYCSDISRNCFGYVIEGLVRESKLKQAEWWLWEAEEYNGAPNNVYNNLGK